MLSDSQIERYARQLVMSEIDDEGQEKLLEAKILVVGAGGLGASALTTLVSAGVGNIGIIDGDNVDLSNLNRQFIHSIHSINTPKTESAATFLQQLNPESKLTLHEGQLTAESANDIIPAYDMVLDCTDRPETRYLINQQCLNHSKPLIFGGAIRTDGQVTAVFPAEDRAHAFNVSFQPVRLIMTKPPIAPKADLRRDHNDHRQPSSARSYQICYWLRCKPMRKIIAV